MAHDVFASYFKKLLTKALNCYCNWLIFEEEIMKDDGVGFETVILNFQIWQGSVAT